MDKFLERHKLPKLIKEELDNLKSLVSILSYILTNWPR